jgi:hypothetical protein
MISREKALLRFYSRFRGRRPGVVEALARQPIGYWFAMCALLAMAWIVAIYSAFPAAQLLLGMIIGGVLRDIGWMLRFKRDWPVLDRVLNWEAVEHRLVEPQNDKVSD